MWFLRLISVLQTHTHTFSQGLIQNTDISKFTTCTRRSKEQRSGQANEKKNERQQNVRVIRKKREWCRWKDENRCFYKLILTLLSLKSKRKREMKFPVFWMMVIFPWRLHSIRYMQWMINTLAETPIPNEMNIQLCKIKANISCIHANTLHITPLDRTSFAYNFIEYFSIFHLEYTSNKFG